METALSAFMDVAGKSGRGRLSKLSQPAGGVKGPLHKVKIALQGILSESRTARRGTPYSGSFEQ